MVPVAGSQPPGDHGDVDAGPLNKPRRVRPTRLRAAVPRHEGEPDAQAGRVGQSERLLAGEDQDADRLVRRGIGPVGVAVDRGDYELAEGALGSLLQLPPCAQAPPQLLLVVGELEFGDQLIVRWEGTISRADGLQSCADICAVDPCRVAACSVLECYLIEYFEGPSSVEVGVLCRADAMRHDIPSSEIDT